MIDERFIVIAKSRAIRRNEILENLFFNSNSTANQNLIDIISKVNLSIFSHLLFLQAA